MKQNKQTMIYTMQKPKNLATRTPQKTS